MGDLAILVAITRRCYAHDLGGLQQAVLRLDYVNADELVEAVDWSAPPRDARIALAKQLRAHGVEREWLEMLERERPNLRSEIAAARSALLDGAPAPAPAVSPDLAVDTGLGEGSERLIGPRDDFLSLAYLERIVHWARGVGRVRVGHADGSEHFGTGWLYAPDILVTNAHVLAPMNLEVRSVTTDFDLREQSDDTVHTPPPVAASVQTIRADQEADVAIVRLDSPQGHRPLARLADSNVAPGARVVLLQHPRGGALRVALQDNVVDDVTDAHLRYQSDTDAGSSGSPVFDDAFRIVGMHRKWVELPTGLVRNQGVGLPVLRAALDRLLAELG